MKIHSLNKRKGVKYLPPLFVLLSMIFIDCPELSAQFPPEIVSVHPGPNEWVDTLTAPVIITLPHDPPQVLNANFFVFGDQTGMYSGTITYDPDTKRVFFNHEEPFKIGEKVTALLTSKVIPGNPGGFMWTFFPMPYRGTGIASDSIIILSGVGRPFSLAAGDFDHDGFLDLASADMNTNEISLFKGDCRTLTKIGSFPTDISPNRITAADLNSDGRLDLIVSHYFEQTITIHNNNGDWNFTTPGRSFDVSPVTPIEYVAVEFTGDDRLDGIISGGNSIGLLVNEGGGNFSLANVMTFPPPDQNRLPSSFPSNVELTTGDVDNDGYLDFYVSVNTDSLVRKFKHKREIPLFVEDKAEAIRLPNRPIQVELVELQAGGLLDLVIATEGFPDQHLLSFWNDGTGRIPPVIRQDIDDVDLPPFLDLYTVNPDPDIDGVLPDFDILANHSTTHTLLFFRNENGGELVRQPDIPTGIDPRHFTGGDFNLDGAIDIAVPNSQDNTIWVFLSSNLSDWQLTIDPTRLDFGGISLCAKETLDILLVNENPFPVDLDSVYLEDNDVFHVTDPSIFPDNLKPGDSLRISIEYRPNAVGSDVDRLIIASERCILKTQTVDLTGNALFPFDHSPDTVVLPETTVGDTAERIVTLSNPFSEGEVEIRVSLKSGSEPFSISPLPCGSPPSVEIYASLSPGSAFEICVRFYPPDQIAYTDTLIIEPLQDGICDFEALKIPLLGEGQINDPPFFIQIPDSSDLVYSEGDSVIVPLFGSDPESDFLDMTYDSILTDLPIGVNPFVSNVRSPCGNFAVCGDLEWSAPELPDSLEYIVFPLFFTIRETETKERYFDILRLPVTVRQLLPDLSIVSLTLQQGGEKNILNRRITVLSSITVSNRDIAFSDPAFTFRLRSDEGEDREHTIDRIEEGEILSFQDTFTFRTLGDHWVEAIIDEENVIEEANEENNRVVLRILVEVGELVVRHNPFTPNGDGYNDRLEFDLTELGLESPELYIFALDGRKIVTLSDPEGDRLYWDGKDGAGRDQRPGAYLFVLKDKNRGITSGTIGLAR